MGKPTNLNRHVPLLCVKGDNPIDTPKKQELKGDTFSKAHHFRCLMLNVREATSPLLLAPKPVEIAVALA